MGPPTASDNRHPTPVTRLGRAALDDLLDRGDMTDWRPLLEEIARDPWGSLADDVLGLVDAHPMGGTSALWRSWIHDRSGGVCVSYACAASSHRTSSRVAST
jgi:hypothetical protein